MESKCCCFIPLKVGVYIIGVLTMLTLLPELYKFFLWRTLLTAAASLAFLTMVVKDSTFTRGLFFFAWNISMFGFLFINIFVAAAEEGGYDAEARAENQCRGMEDEYLSNFFFGTFDACKLAAERYIVYELVAVLVPSILLSIYWSYVLYRYWSEPLNKSEIEENLI